jgi:carbamate kinase
VAEGSAPLTLVALGGNTLIRPGGRGTLAEQEQAVTESLAAVVELIRRGHDVILTHGNGPQVGAILTRVEEARDRAYDLPLDACVAQSQGELGYTIAQCLDNLLHARGLHKEVACVLTRVVVDADDPHLKSPSKPIGPVLTAERAAALTARGGAFVEEKQRGLRRVVASPWPRAVLETESIRRLLAAGVVVIAAGGGGVAVCRRGDGTLAGVEAVVDKDLTSGLLAAALGAPRMLNLTAVAHAKLDFDKPGERDLESLDVAQARRYLAAGHFAPGSMGPKIEGAIYFLEHGGREVIITTPERAGDALAGQTGTHIRSDDAAVPS